MQSNDLIFNDFQSIFVKVSFLPGKLKGFKMELNVLHDKKNQKFYVKIENKESSLLYNIINEHTLDFLSTFVPIEQRGQSIAAKITDVALQYAKDNNYKVIPTCPFIKHYIDTHPNYRNLVE